MTIARRLSRCWALWVSVAVHGAAVGALALRFEPAPLAVPALAVDLAAPAAAIEPLPETAPTPDLVATAAPPSALRMQGAPDEPIEAAEVPPDTVRAAEPQPVEAATPIVETVQAAAPMLVAQAAPAVIESRAVEAVELPPPPRSRPRPPARPEPAAHAAPAPAPRAEPEPPAEPSQQQATALHTARAAAGATQGPPPDYLTTLRAWLERHKQYPRAAQLRRREGTALLRFVIDRDGRVLSHRIERSSGHALLDEAVEAMIARAAPLPAMPAAMREDRLELVVPVSFFLR